MTPLAITFLIISIALIGGGLAASTVALARQTERDDYPAGGEGEAG